MKRRDKIWTTTTGAMLVALSTVGCGATPIAPTAAAGAADNRGAAPSAVSAEPVASASLAPTASPQPARTVAGAEVTSVALETGSSSAVIRMVDDPTYTVERVVHFDGPATGPEPGPSHRLDGTTLVLDGCHLPDCYFAYTVTVPFGTAVRGKAGSGATTVESASEVNLESGTGTVGLIDIAGPVRIKSGSGPVTLDDIRGNVVVETGSGPIEGEALAGSATVVESGSGPIDLTFATVQTISATSGSGSVNLAVAPGRYRVLTDHEPSRTEVGIASDPGADTAVFVGPGSGRVTVTSAS